MPEPVAGLAEGGLSLEEVGERLGASKRDCLGLRGVPNARVDLEVRMLAWLAERRGRRRWGKCARPGRRSLAARDPEAFWALRRAAVRVEVSWRQG